MAREGSPSFRATILPAADPVQALSVRPMGWMDTLSRRKPPRRGVPGDPTVG